MNNYTIKERTYVTLSKSFSKLNTLTKCTLLNLRPSSPVNLNLNMYIHRNQHTNVTSRLTSYVLFVF